jgi:formylmethanofuran dehydrogenase subunit E
MFKEKKKKISATGIFSCNIMVIDDTTLQWIDAKEFNLADLAKAIGIDHEHKAKATITIEIVEQPCELCGKITTGDKICENCGKLVCDGCAKTDSNGNRYCPICFDLKTLQNIPIS